MQLIKTVFILLTLTLLTFCNNGDESSFSASAIIEGTAIKVAAQTGGQILQFPVEEGEAVVIGQKIAVVDTEKLALQLDQIQAGLQEIEIQRQINLNTLQKAEADYENISKKYKRFQELYNQNSASQQTLDDLKTALEAATTQLQNVKQNMRLLESKKSGLDAQRKLLRRQINDAIVKVPSAGTLTTKYFEAGETIAPGFSIAEVIDLSRVWTKMYISELLLPKIKTGDEVKISIDGTEKYISGRVSWISPKAEFTPKNILTDETRTSLVYAVKVLIDNPDGILKHGMPVKVNLAL